MRDVSDVQKLYQAYWDEIIPKKAPENPSCTADMNGETVGQDKTLSDFTAVVKKTVLDKLSPIATSMRVFDLDKWDRSVRAAGTAVKNHFKK